MISSKSNPTAQKAQEIENSPTGKAGHEPETPAFERGSLIRNDPGDDDAIVIKRWHLDICKGNTDAALMLANLILVFDVGLAPITGAEVTVDTFYLSVLTFGVGHQRRIPAALNKLQSMGLITARQLTDSEWLASSHIRRLFGTTEKGLAAAKEMIERSDPAFKIRIESHAIESWIEGEYGQGIPPWKHLVLPSKNSGGARSTTGTSRKSSAVGTAA